MKQHDQRVEKECIQRLRSSLGDLMGLPTPAQQELDFGLSDEAIYHLNKVADKMEIPREYLTGEK